MEITHHNPDTLISNPAFSQAVSVEGAGRLVFVGGQNGVRADGRLAGEDLGSQTEQALENVLEALKAAGASQKDVVRLGIYIVEGQDPGMGFAASQKVWGMHPTAITVLTVSGLGPPGAVVEIEAIAAVET